MSVSSFKRKPLKIAIVGTRGIPAAYGGFETFAEELSIRLVKRGHSVTVFGRCSLRDFFKRRGDRETVYQGVRCLAFPTIRHKYLDTPVNGILSLLFILFNAKRYDVVLVCNAANSPFLIFPKLVRVPTIINVDGIERQRAKWNFLGRGWYRLGEVCSVLLADKVVADAEVIARYYRERYKIEPAVIAYGANARKAEDESILRALGLRKGEYLLYVSRLEPENNALGVIQAYNKIVSSYPLVIVGDAPYADEYKERLKAEADERVIFAGFQFKDPYWTLQRNCYLYIQATEVGGTHPALVEAMSYGNCIIANGTPENKEVLGDAGLFYEKNNFFELASLIQRCLSDKELVKELGKRAKERANKYYRWESIVDAYETLFFSLLSSKLTIASEQGQRENSHHQ